MSSIYDPYSGAQIRFLRSDPTGRLTPLGGKERRCNWLIEVLLGAALWLVLVICAAL